MSDIILSNDELTVLGGPAKINLEVDFGPQGDRGSQIFICNGDPNETAIGQTPKVFDLCINNLTSHQDYLFYYQYINNAGTNEWVKLFKLLPNIYSNNYIKNFGTTGESIQINIPLINLVPSEVIGNISSSNFNVQHSILNQKPVASSIMVGEIVEDNNDLILPITISALEYSLGNWSYLTGNKTVHIFITMV
jgi:hypothetical protein